jgi:hypothetical protein
MKPFADACSKSDLWGGRSWRRGDVRPNGDVS